MKIKMNLLENILELIFPTKCGFCNELIKKEYTCKKCKKKLEYICTDNKMQKITGMYFDFFISSYFYLGIVRKKILEFKFKNKKYLYRTLSEKLAYNLQPYIKDIDYITAVPISLKRYFERGYNQSILIAKYISKRLNKPLIKFTLIKIRDNKKQSELGMKQRNINVKNVYKVLNKNIIFGKRILLIDDIFTTGATVNECSRILKQYGAQSIIVATVAKADINKHSI